MHGVLEGLLLDGAGGFRLSDLMVTWGHRHGLREGQVLDALRSRMLRRQDHDHKGRVDLRFVIDKDELGHIVIKVQPKRGNMAQSPSDAPLLRTDWRGSQTQHKPSCVCFFCVRARHTSMRMIFPRPLNLPKPSKHVTTIGF